jgi:hypothetical protein
VAERLGVAVKESACTCPSHSVVPPSVVTTMPLAPVLSTWIGRSVESWLSSWSRVFRYEAVGWPCAVAACSWEAFCAIWPRMLLASFTPASMPESACWRAVATAPSSPLSVLVRLEAAVTAWLCAVALPGEAESEVSAALKLSSMDGSEVLSVGCPTTLVYWVSRLTICSL